MSFYFNADLITNIGVLVWKSIRLAIPGLNMRAKIFLGQLDNEIISIVFSFTNFSSASGIPSLPSITM